MFEASTRAVMTSFVFAEESMKLTFLAKEKDCYANMTTVAVGGGGRGSSHSGSYTGGGSGFVETGSAIIRTNSIVNLFIRNILEEEIGRGAMREETKIISSTSVRLDEELVVEAKQGVDGGYCGSSWGPSPSGQPGGGDGYSGGGGCGRSSDSPGGGQNGGDGGNGTSPGGRGSGLDVGQITMKWFELTPGAGGDYWVKRHDTKRYGGGGGGILVNGNNGTQNTQSKNNGEGYGGGGGINYNYNINIHQRGIEGASGNTGCVLIEV